MIKKIAVIGAGTMGHAMAGCFAVHGYEVSIFETFEAVRESCKEKIARQYEFLSTQDVIKQDEIEDALNRITMYEDLKKAVEEADYVIEAIPENLELKQDLFERLGNFCKPDAILASNTSSLSFEKLTEKTTDDVKSRMMVCHWYNPAHIMPLVELSFFGNMSEEVYREVEELYIKIEKRPAKVRKDIPGLLANRIQQGIAREVFSLIEMGAADPSDIETALKFGPAFRYATTGQLEVADFGGLDIWSAVGDNLLSVMDRSTQANPLLKEKVKEGKLGFKTGEGFFKYPEDEKQNKQDDFNKRLLIQLKASKNY